MVMMGWVVKAEPLTLPAAEVVIATWAAVPATTLATCTGLPLLCAFEVTTAVRLPRDGAVARVTVNWVAVALVTVPVPLLRVTVLLAAVVSKPVPVTISVVALAARLLVLRVTVGRARYVYNTLAALVPLGVVTSTLAVPALPAGVVAVIEVALTTVTFVAAVPPIVTPVAPVNPVPVMLTACPPANGPEVELMDATVGAAR